jgi:preprotein translocase SecE subunit
VWYFLSAPLFNGTHITDYYPMNAVVKYLRSSIQEFNNVTWPTRKQAVRISTVVFVFMIVSAIVLGVVDQVLSVAYKGLFTIAQ